MYVVSSYPKTFEEVYRELLAIQNSQEEVNALSFKIWNAAPSKPRQGHLYYADGANWNPGEGEGFYSYDGSAYQALQHLWAQESAGDVGLGVSPSYKLHLVKSDANFITRFDNSHATAPRGIQIYFSAASPDDNTQIFLECVDSTTARLQVFSDGDVLNHDGTYGTLSDARLKQDISNSSSQWDDVKAIGAVGKQYRHIKDVGNKGNQAKVMLGWLAQDVEAISPGLIIRSKDKDDNEVLAIKSSILFTKAVIALSEAMARIESLEARVSALESV